MEHFTFVRLSEVMDDKLEIVDVTILDDVHRFLQQSLCL